MTTRKFTAPGTLLAASVAALLIASCAKSAPLSSPPQVNRGTNLTVVQQEGYATLKWRPVAGATAYDIERTPIDAAGTPTDSARITGVWRPNRQIKQETPSFADAGFVPGVRLRWRVRARTDSVAQPFSEPVIATTMARPGPAEFITEFETLQGAQYTSHDAEMDWTRRIAAASRRVRVVQIGKTAQGRAINLFIIGNPAPLATVAQISAAPTAGANCNVHGNEPSGREGCFMMIRDLAFSNEKWVTDILSNTTVLIVPSFNGDGRAANQRGNSTGQDLNRDHGRLTQPETQVFAAFVRDYTPEVMVDGHEFGSTGTCDLPLLWSRHSNTAPAIHNEGKTGFIEGFVYNAGANDGWWGCPYPPAGITGASSFTRVSGLKNMIVTLVEARSSGGPSRPAEGNAAENRRRKAYSQLWMIRQALEYHRANRPAIQKAIADGIAFQRSNQGRIVFHGDWPAPGFPAPHPGDTPPPDGTPGPDNILDPPPCGYFLTEAQYNTKLNDSGSLPDSLKTSPAQRLAAHGIQVERQGTGYLVRMTQPLRGLINIVLDEKTPPAPIIAAQRVFDCSR